jgi:hypothetical protein
LKIQKDIDIYKSRKITRKHKKKHVQRIAYDVHSDIQSYKCFKAKKKFDSALNDESKKVGEASKIQKKSK